MNKLEVNKFELISISGRFIYGYLCLLNAIDHSKSSILPPELNELCEEFVSSDKLDDWHSKVEDILPSFILDVEEIDNKYFSVSTVKRIKNYYKEQSPFIVDIIDNLFWLGISNLYSAYSSPTSLKYLETILKKMYVQQVPLPDFERIKMCSAAQRRGWGEYDNLKNYIDAGR